MFAPYSVLPVTNLERRCKDTYLSSNHIVAIQKHKISGAALVSMQKPAASLLDFQVHRICPVCEAEFAAMLSDLFVKAPLLKQNVITGANT